MSGRHTSEWCPHCRSNQRSTWKGTGLYCDTGDHFIRSRSKKSKAARPASTNMYEVVRAHIADTFSGRGAYDWDELITWCTRAKFEGLRDFCQSMKDLETEVLD